MVCTGEVLEALQVRLPIADGLIIKTVDDVFAQNKIWQIHVGLVAEQSWGNQVCLMYRATLIALAYCGQDLLAQPNQISLELRQHSGRGEIPRKRLVAMEQIPRILLYHDVDRIHQPLKVALLDERCPQIRHDEIADEQNALIRQVDEHRILSFASSDRNEILSSVRRSTVMSGLKLRTLSRLKASPKNCLSNTPGALRSRAISSP